MKLLLSIVVLVGSVRGGHKMDGVTRSVTQTALMLHALTEIHITITYENSYSYGSRTLVAHTKSTGGQEVAGSNPVAPTYIS
jgi:hypothetical protein